MISISAVVPLYGVERYLPDLLASLAAQKPGGYSLEVIFVDDGSPDASGRLAEEWLARSGVSGRVIRQQNAGVSVARNAGLALATGEWVTFPDPDDYLASDYFREVSRFIRRHGQDVAVVSVRLMRQHGVERSIRDVHALQFRFMAGNRCVSLEEFPDFVQLNVASAFFRTEELQALNMAFIPGLHASEDALFIADYLLRTDRAPVVGLVADTHYVYRKRTTGDSATDAFRESVKSHVDRFRDGYLPLMQRAAAGGSVPLWLQSVFLYEMQWLLPVQLVELRRAALLGENTNQQVLAHLAACARLVDEDRLFRYDATALPMETRLLLELLVGREIPAWVPASLGAGGETLVWAADPTTVHARGSDGAVVSDAEYRDDAPDYFGQSLLHRITIIGDGVAAVEADGYIRRVPTVHRGETAAQQQDRVRRERYGQLHAAIPARTGEVRVWKPVPGPFGSPAARVRWRLMLARRRFGRWRRAWLR